MQRDRLRLDIPDMKCSGCAERIETVLRRNEGVMAVASDPEKKQATVRYDADTTTPDVLLDAIEQAGYSPTRS